MVRLLVRVGATDGLLQLVCDQLELQHCVLYTVSELALKLCRRLSLVEQREVCVAREDVLLSLALAFSKHDHERIENVKVSDVLFLLYKLKQHALSTDKEPPDPTIKLYRENMTNCKLVDVFHLLKKLLNHNKDELKATLESSFPSDILLVIPRMDKHFVDVELLELLSSVADISRVQLETPLDASLCEQDEQPLKTPTVALEPLDLSSLKQLCSSARPSRLSRLESEKRYCQAWIEGCLRLLVNSRDDVATAKVLNGPVIETIDHDAFTAIRKMAAAKAHYQPMFQAVLSYVQRSRLGSSSSSVLNDFGPGLHDLVDHIDLMRERMEEIEDYDVFSSKMIKELRKQLVKSKSSLSNEALSYVLSNVEEILKEQSESRGEGSEEQKAKSESAMEKNLKLIRDVVDTLTTGLVSDRPVSWMVLMGKVEPEFAEARSPLGVPSLVKLFATPHSDDKDEEDEDDPFAFDNRSLAERVGNVPTAGNVASGISPGEQQRVEQGLPRYKAAMAWAPEYSPVGEDDGIRRFMVPKEKKELTENQLLLQKLVREERIASRRVEAAIAEHKKLPIPPRRRKRSLLHNVLTPKPAKRQALAAGVKKSEKGQSSGRQQTKLTSFFKSK